MQHVAKAQEWLKGQADILRRGNQRRTRARIERDIENYLKGRQHLSEVIRFKLTGDEPHLTLTYEFDKSCLRRSGARHVRSRDLDDKLTRLVHVRNHPRLPRAGRHRSGLRSSERPCSLSASAPAPLDGSEAPCPCVYLSARLSAGQPSPSARPSRE